MLLSDCLPHLLYKFSHESDLIKAIEEVSQKFTTDRAKISDYLKDPRLASAYTAFYLTTNAPKLKAALDWLPTEFKHSLKNLPLVDLGAGPGTFSLAWRELFDGPVYQIETSSVMREQARLLWDGIHPGDSLHQLPGPREIPGSVLLFGHSANEMGHKEALKYIEAINPDHVLFIEPGTKAFFQEMIIIRSHLLERKFNIIYPCPTSLECPMANSQKDWCHQFMKVRHDPEVERLTQIVHKDRKLLPIIMHLYSRIHFKQDSQRIVRVLPETKFSFEWEVCVGESIDSYQVMKRGIEKKRLKQLSEILAGASINTELEKDMGAVKRVKLIDPLS